MNYEPFQEPLPWYGPYSPARGTNSGFRIRNRRLGIYTNDDSEPWLAKQTNGVRELEQQVIERYGGGRILFLPSGHVIKPDSGGTGHRSVIGKYKGEFSILGRENGIIDFSSEFEPGSRWLGPNNSIGLECQLEVAGNGLQTEWYIPRNYGRDNNHEEIAIVNPNITHMFEECRPNIAQGRIQLLIGGHIITKTQEGYSNWVTYYIGRIDLSQFNDWEQHIGG